MGEGEPFACVAGFGFAEVDFWVAGLADVEDAGGQAVFGGGRRGRGAREVFVFLVAAREPLAEDVKVGFGIGGGEFAEADLDVVVYPGAEVFDYWSVYKMIMGLGCVMY